MALIKSVAFVLFEISSNLVSMQKILKTFLRELTFIFDVLSESLFVFVSYSGICLKRTPSVQKNLSALDRCPLYRQFS